MLIAAKPLPSEWYPKSVASATTKRGNYWSATAAKELANVFVIVVRRINLYYMAATETTAAVEEWMLVNVTKEHEGNYFLTHVKES